MKHIGRKSGILLLALSVLVLLLGPGPAYAGVSPDGWATQNSGMTWTLYGVCGSSAGDMFAVGDYGTILHSDNGSTWSPMDSGVTNVLFGVWGSASDNVFAVGANGRILHYEGEGTSWTAMDSGTNRHLHGIWGRNSSDVFAVGNNGLILHYDGASWSPMTSANTRHLRGVWGSHENDVYAVGDGGLILHFDGTQWHTDLVDKHPSLTGIWASSSGNVFVVGAQGTVLNYDGIDDDGDGSPWDWMTSVTGDDLSGVWGTSSTDVFAVGDNGRIIHYDGNTWTPMASGVANGLFSAWGTDLFNAYAVGQEGTILHYKDGTPIVSGVAPCNAEHGHSITVRVSGYGLTGSTGLSFGDGITVDDNFTVDNPTQITAYITISPAAVPGARDVTVTNGFGSGTKAEAFTVTEGSTLPLTTDFTCDRTIVVVGQIVSFTDNSTGGVAPLSYQWDFNNDGIWDSTVQNPTNSYGTAGTYTVVLEVTDSATNADTETRIDLITVSALPGADFFADRTVAVVGQTVNFADNSTGGVAPLSYQWDFNNDGIWDSTAQNPTHSYSSVGTYTVVLEVTDSATNADTCTKIDLITVSAVPVADFTADRTVVIVGQTVNFADNSTGGVAPLSYQWDFNNDGIWDSTAQNPSYAFTVPGTYTVVLNIADSASNTGSEVKTDLITVNPPAPDVTSVSPSHGMRGQSLSVVITGTDLTEAMSISFGNGITVDSYAVDGSTHITASITIGDRAETGLRTVSVQTPSGTDTLSDGFSVMLPAPIVGVVSPASGIAGETLDVIISGSDFDGATAVDFGPGVTVNNFVIDSASQITANVTIDPAAQPGDNDITVTTPSGDGILTMAFTIEVPEETSGVSVAWWFWILPFLLAALLGLLLFSVIKRRRKKTGNPQTKPTPTPRRT